jgi:ATP synthase protein I
MSGRAPPLTVKPPSTYVPHELRKRPVWAGGRLTRHMARGPDKPAGKDIRELGDKIDAIRKARTPKVKDPGGKYSAAGFGWRMTIDLVVGIMVGAAIGWGLDALFGTIPLFLIVMTMFGFAAGVRVMLMSVKDYEKDQAGGRKDPADKD